jgi:cytochrome c2
LPICSQRLNEWVVPGLLAAVVCASTAATVSKAEATGDAAAGEHVFIVCHSPKAGENKIGPSLAGVFGRKSGSAPGYNYSPALQSAGITWDEQELDKYLANPLLMYMEPRWSSAFPMPRIAKMSSPT